MALSTTTYHSTDVTELSAGRKPSPYCETLELPRKVVNAPSVEVFKARLNEAWSKLL